MNRLTRLGRIRSGLLFERQCSIDLSARDNHRAQVLTTKFDTPYLENIAGTAFR